jgi:N-acetylmuramoyl-L-alanine amidase
MFLLLAIPVYAESPGPQSIKTLTLDEALSALGTAAELRWDPFFSSGALIYGTNEAAFASGKEGETGMVLLNHRDILTLPLPFFDGGTLRFPETFLQQIKSNFSRYVEEDRDKFRIAAIIIDPGHGGKDPGASFAHTVQGKALKSVEKDITLKVSRLLYSALTAAYPDKRILLTREGDTNPTKDARVNMANSVPLGTNEAAIYVSVHANSSLNKSARGYEVWYLTPSYRREVIDRNAYSDSREVLPILNSMMEEELTTESILLANYILKRMGETVGKQSPSRGLKAEEWFVVRNARMPAVLVELGFVSNETDALLMDSDVYLKNLSDALYKGISDFIAFFERSGGLTAYQ